MTTYGGNLKEPEIFTNKKEAKKRAFYFVRDWKHEYYSITKTRDYCELCARVERVNNYDDCGNIRDVIAYYN